MVKKGDRAPEFTLLSDEGNPVSLRDFRGQKLLIYFYPKDNTPGCTTQACDLRDEMPTFRAADLAVVGISPDSVESHRKFKAKFSLNFTLLADTEHDAAESYGVWKRKSMFGRKYWGIERSSFLVDSEGRVEEIWRRVSPKKHAGMVAERLEG